MNRLAMRHVRLLGSMLAGIAVFWLLPEGWALVSRLLTGWNVFTLSFLALAFIWMAGLSPKEIGERYQEEDEAAPVILLVVIAAALTSLLAIVALLVSAKHAGDEERNFRIELAALTVASSWVLAATMFTLHYAEMFYRAKTDARTSPPPTDPSAASCWRRR